MPLFKHLLTALALAAMASGCAPSSNSTGIDAEAAAEEEWLTLFNGRDLEDWIIKIAGHPPGENALNTFSVKDGKMVVSYDEYDQLNDRWHGAQHAAAKKETPAKRLA